MSIGFLKNCSQRRIFTLANRTVTIPKLCRAASSDAPYEGNTNKCSASLRNRTAENIFHRYVIDKFAISL
ncbi:hypothetical protein SELSPUOL_02203 [Selenomonas sputigena ATCC 35185]|uniref:Uncharacterized protein n=1 Tax=Selenomonas sputigena (strain ATCC 35185 / DSM 20758 / CCUG 44933 / VPI D19B-28) TaxID=546271 RepID=C9LXJ5_SELS3|nr:hypothetical protein SELSPUOL_02203 [Selenomonas sputigena ATCC 35185]